MEFTLLAWWFIIIIILNPIDVSASIRGAEMEPLQPPPPPLSKLLLRLRRLRVLRAAMDEIPHVLRHLFSPPSR